LYIAISVSPPTKLVVEMLICFLNE
jgi:hypothetical protein